MTLIEAASDPITRVRTTASTATVLEVFKTASSDRAKRHGLPVERRAGDEFDAWLLDRRYAEYAASLTDEDEARQAAFENEAIAVWAHE